MVGREEGARLRTSAGWPARSSSAPLPLDLLPLIRICLLSSSSVSYTSACLFYPSPHPTSCYSKRDRAVQESSPSPFPSSSPDTAGHSSPLRPIPVDEANGNGDARLEHRAHLGWGLALLAEVGRVLLLDALRAGDLLRERPRDRSERIDEKGRRRGEQARGGRTRRAEGGASASGLESHGFGARARQGRVITSMRPGRTSLLWVQHSMKSSSWSAHSLLKSAPT